MSFENELQIIGPYYWEPYCFRKYAFKDKTTFLKVKVVFSDELAKEVADENQRYAYKLRDLQMEHMQRVMEIKNHWRDQEAILGLTKE